MIGLLCILLAGLFSWQIISHMVKSQHTLDSKLDSLELVLKQTGEKVDSISQQKQEVDSELKQNKAVINDLQKKLIEIRRENRNKINNPDRLDEQRKSLPVPQNVWIEYAEKNMVINWDPVPGAIGYNVYRGAKETTEKVYREKLNKVLITSDNRFVFIWRFNNGQRERTVKGYKHYISVTAVFNQNGHFIESVSSQSVSNDYFNGFSDMTSEKRILSVLQDKQESAYIPTIYGNNDKYAFIKFMIGPGRYLTDILRDSLDFQEVGACDPVSTIALKLLSDWGLYALRAEGIFIEEYHVFIIIKVENVEYVLDFTADQFVPDVAPVMVPRDLCFLNKEGRLDVAGKPVYLIEKVYPADTFELTNTKKSRVYHNIYQKVYNEFFSLEPVEKIGDLEIIR